MATGNEKKFDKMSFQKKLDWISGLSQDQQLRYLFRIKNKGEQDKISAQVPGLSELAKLNEGMQGGGRTGGLGHGSTSGNYLLPTEPKNIRDFRERALGLGGQGLEGMLESLRNPQETPFNEQLRGVFGHLQNNVLQNLMNPANNQIPGTMFPSEMQDMSQQYQMQQPGQNGGIGGAAQNLLGLIGQNLWKNQAVPYLNRKETPEELYNMAQQYGPQAYDYAMGSRPVQALQGLGNAAQGLGSFAQDKWNFAKTLPGEARKDISSLLGGLQNYADVGYGQIREPQTYGQSAQQLLGTLMQPFVHPSNFASGIKQAGSKLFNKKGK